MTAIVSLILGSTLIYIARPFSALLFFVIMLIFCYMASIYGSLIVLTEESVKRLFSRRILAEYKWNEIKEVGVIGTKAFAKNKHTGTLYIYISKTVLSKQERFDLVFSWPPKNKIFLTYDKERLEAIQLSYSSEIQTYNAGDIEI
nr:hypothetical protein [uncultured Sphaerochaeta sp.]